MHILIVEDDERIVSFMKRGLEAESYEVAIASSKVETLDLTATYTYDVIILDIFLGPDDGLDICLALRQRGVDSSILLMTAKGTAEMEKTSRHAGADAYLAKPFSFDDLIATITRLSMSAKPTTHPGSTMERCTNPLEKPSPEAFTKSDTGCKLPRSVAHMEANAFEERLSTSDLRRGSREPGSRLLPSDTPTEPETVSPMTTSIRRFDKQAFRATRINSMASLDSNIMVRYLTQD